MIKTLQSMLARPWVPARHGNRPYLWLMSLAFLSWSYLDAGPSLVEGIWLVLTLLVFLPLYLASYWSTPASAPLYVLLVALIGVLWTPYNTGASTFFIFACGMCAAMRPTRHAHAMMAAVLALALLSAALLARFPIGFLLPALIVGIPVGLGGISESVLSQSRMQLMRKQEEVEHMATIAERERISRDLHDLLGHTLSLITLKAELAGKLIERDIDACRREVRDIETSARAALSEVRSAVSGYRQTGFAHELASARASLAAAEVELVADVAAFTLPAAAENVMSLALREAVTNIVRHAGATRCEVRLALDAGIIVFRIADNGALLADAAALRQGNGLVGMGERVAAIGGKLALTVERGLALELRLPLGTPA
jgi:two-component system sensor histidine kinase DesK